jgi:AcrR family transcriptional regulator
VNASVIPLRDRQREHTRSEIVRVAFELFGTHGYEKVSVEMIAAEAGISRATFFNYFPQKELILREVASARAEKLKATLAALQASGPTPTIEGILQLILKLSAENARISHHSKKLMIEAFVHQVSRGLMLAIREQVVDALTQILAKALKSAPRRPKPDPKAIAETLMAVYIATMLEWLMRESIPQNWLVETMRQRMQLVLEGTR